jgi:hypothetical protein
MYEIVVRIGDKEIVVETVDNIVTASNYVSFHRQRGTAAFYRAVLKKVA